MKQRKPGPTPKVRERIVNGAILLAQGHTFVQVADKLGITVRKLDDYQYRHPQLWDAAERAAIENIVAIVRANAGTDAVLENPDMWLRMATDAEKWAQARNEPLFPSCGDMTLTEFYEAYYKPNCIVPDASDGYCKLIAIVLKRWRLVTGDPPLDKITTALLAKFRDFLIHSRGQKPGSRMSPITVRNFLKHIHAVLVKAGPKGYRNFDAAELIPSPPCVRLPRAEQPPPKIVSAGQINLVYNACDVMVVPDVVGIKPGDWWRALIVVAYNTGLRRRTLFEAELSSIDWKHQQMDLPAHQLKSRRSQTVYLNETAFRHLRHIRKPDREKLFPWPYGGEYFSQMFRRLQYEAGLPRRLHFGLQALRRTLATKLWADSPQAAQWALGHAKSDLTRKHYVAGDELIAEALDRLQQPEAFGKPPPSS